MGVLPIEIIDIIGNRANLESFLLGEEAASYLILIPKVLNSGIWHQFPIPFLAGITGQGIKPDCVHPNIRRRIILEDFPLDPTGTSPSLGSSRGEQKYQANGSIILVEQFSEFIYFLEVLKGGRGNIRWQRCGAA